MQHILQTQYKVLATQLGIVYRLLLLLVLYFYVKVVYLN